MAVFVSDVRQARDPITLGFTEGICSDYFIDVEADITSLPIQPAIKETSTALCPATGRVAVLMTSGWVWLS